MSLVDLRTYQLIGLGLGVFEEAVVNINGPVLVLYQSSHLQVLVLDHNDQNGQDEAYDQADIDVE